MGRRRAGLPGSSREEKLGAVSGFPPALPKRLVPGVCSLARCPDGHTALAPPGSAGLAVVRWGPYRVPPDRSAAARHPALRSHVPGTASDS